MKIERENIRLSNPSYRPGDVTARPVPTAELAAALPSDSVTLSEQARQAAALREKLAAAPEVRSAMIARLKAQIEEGTYQVHSDRVAEKIQKARVLDE